MPHPPVSIIVPTYKEAENIPILTQRVFDALQAAEIIGELVFVDDNSRDGTPEVVAELANEHAVRLITRTNERGLSSAVVRGFVEAQYDLLVCMDADLSHPPESLPTLMGPVVSGDADFVIGSRYTAGGKTKEDWGFLRQINSTVATLLAKPLTTASDPMAGFFCLRRETLRAAEQAGLNPIGYKIGLEILIKARCRRVREIPIDFSDRMHGKSKLTIRQQLEYLLHLWRLYRFRWPALFPMLSVASLAIVVIAIWRIMRG